MYQAVAVIELKSIARGIEAADAALKSAGVRLISSHGESIPGAIPQTGNTNTKCRMDRPVERWIEDWCDAGPTHHLALGVGNHTEEIAIFARMMGIEMVEV